MQAHTHAHTRTHAQMESVYDKVSRGKQARLNESSVTMTRLTKAHDVFVIVGEFALVSVSVSVRACGCFLYRFVLAWVCDYTGEPYVNCSHACVGLRASWRLCV